MKRLASLLLVLVLVLAAFPLSVAAANPQQVSGKGETITFSDVVEVKTQKVYIVPPEGTVADKAEHEMTIYYLAAGSTISYSNPEKAGMEAYTKLEADTYQYLGFAPAQTECNYPTEDLTLARISGSDGYPAVSAYYLVVDTAASPATAEAETTNATLEQRPATPTPPPAGENTVLVAGTYRTPGQIQNASSGDYLYTVNYGDTLYDLSARFYGTGDLWKELQAANQEWINETADGMIFVGFNLLIPAELGDVRANIG